MISAFAITHFGGGIVPKTDAYLLRFRTFLILASSRMFRRDFGSTISTEPVGKPYTFFNILLDRANIRIASCCALTLAIFSSHPDHPSKSTIENSFMLHTGGIDTSVCRVTVHNRSLTRRPASRLGDPNDLG